MILEYSQLIKDQIANFLEQLKKLGKNDCRKIGCVVCAVFNNSLDFFPRHHKCTKVPVFLYLFFCFCW